MLRSFSKGLAIYFALTLREKVHTSVLILKWICGDGHGPHALLNHNCDISIYDEICGFSRSWGILLRITEATMPKGNGATLSKEISHRGTRVSVSFVGVS